MPRKRAVLRLHCSESCIRFRPRRREEWKRGQPQPTTRTGKVRFESLWKAALQTPPFTIANGSFESRIKLAVAFKTEYRAPEKAPSNSSSLRRSFLRAIEEFSSELRQSVRQAAARVITLRDWMPKEKAPDLSVAVQGSKRVVAQSSYLALVDTIEARGGLRDS